jgi:Prokaryotic E2 family E
VILPAIDQEYLERAGIPFRVFEEGGMLNVELVDFALPAGLNSTTASVLFRLSPNYPDSPPDMWWVIPHLTSVARGTIEATGNIETYDGRSWQRWSRHLEPGAWKSGIDSLESYIRLLRTELASAAA